MIFQYWKPSALLALLFTTTLSSCDSFLDIHPEGEKIEQDLFATSRGTEEAIYGVYGHLIQNSLYGRNLLWGVNEVLAQNLRVPLGELSVPLSRYEYDNANVSPTIHAIWSSAYRAIGHANNALKNVEQHREYARQPLYKGELLGLRAFLHFDLLRLFAPTDTTRQGIPYVTQFTHQVTPYSSVGENYRQILADLDAADALLATDENLLTTPRNNQRASVFENYRHTHFNRYAVWATKARVYQAMGNKSQAAYYALRVIDSQKFPLVQRNEVKDFLAGYLSEKETIFGLHAPLYQETAKSQLFEQVTGRSYSAFVKGTSRVLESYEDIFAADNNNSSADHRIAHFNLSTYVRLFKLVDYYALDANLGTRNTNNLIAGISMIRSAEMYLIAAESLLETDPDRARNLFDQLISSRGLTTFAEQGKNLTETNIVNEFRKEFFGEGLFWYMMKRKNLPIKSNALNTTVAPSEQVYNLPIPTDESAYRQ